MKNRVLALFLCAAAVLFSVSGCGMKLPKSGESSPESSKSPDSAASAVIGVVDVVDGESVTLDLVKPADPPEDEEDVTANIVAVGDKAYALTGGTVTIDIANGPSCCWKTRRTAWVRWTISMLTISSQWLSGAKR
jgi:predicted small lipoprotein YifL